MNRAGALYAARNILKAWALALGISGALAGVGYAAGGLRGLSLFVFCGLLLAGRPRTIATGMVPPKGSNGPSAAGEFHKPR